MAVKKKKKVAAKPKTSKAKAGLAGLKKTSKKIVDNVLVKINPQLQGKIDALIKTLENSREGRMNNLSLLAGKILVRAQEVSRSLRTERKTGSRKK